MTPETEAPGSWQSRLRKRDEEIEALRAQVAQLQGQLEAARRDALTEAERACRKIASRHRNMFTSGIDYDRCEAWAAGAAERCIEAIQKLKAETGAGEKHD